MIVQTAIPSATRPGAPRSGGETTRRLPLYLYGRVPTHVRLDGPALLVCRAGKADARYPLGRLARVVCGLGVEWTARALAACLEHDLPIVFLDRAGQPAGYLHAAQTKPSRLDEVLEELLDRPDGPTQYAIWLRAERMSVLAAWRRDRAGKGQDIAEGDYRELVRRHVYRCEDAQIGLAGEHIYRSAVYAHALEQVQKAGARPIYWGHHGAPLQLAADLAGILYLGLSLELRGLGSAAHGDDAALLTVLHAYGSTLTQRCNVTLGRLHRRMKEQLEEWR